MHLLSILVKDLQIQRSRSPGHVHGGQAVGGIFSGIGGEGVPLALSPAHLAIQPGVQGDELGVILVGCSKNLQLVLYLRPRLGHVVLGLLPVRAAEDQGIGDDISLVGPDLHIIGGLRQQVQVQGCCPSPLSGVQRILVELIFFFIIDAQSQVAGLRRLIDRSNCIGGIFCLIGGKGEPLSLLPDGLAFQLGVQRNLLGTLPLASPRQLHHLRQLFLWPGDRCALRLRTAPAFAAAWRFLPAGCQRQQQRGRQHQG